MHPRNLFRSIVVLVAASAALGGCGGRGFDPASKIKGLRVLAVKKEVLGVMTDQGHPDAYGAPGQRVSLNMLYVDEKSTEEHKRPIQIQWFGQAPFNCFNPPGDLYAGCFRGLVGGGTGPRDAGAMPRGDGEASSEASAPEEAGATLDAGLAEGGPSDGALDAAIADALADRELRDAGGADLEAAAPEASDVDGSTPGGVPDLTSSYAIDIPALDAPDNIVRAVPGTAAPYGLAFAFFALCAGQFTLVPNATPGAFPLTCVDGDGKVLGSDDFVAGYTAVYVYDPHPAMGEAITNNNPVVTGFQFDGETVDPAHPPHVMRCASTSSDDCPTHAVKAMIDKDQTMEEDVGARGPDGQRVNEQDWVAFYATGGSFAHDLRLVSDATAGWNDDHGTDWHIPSDPGPAKIWAVVHDNRGGVGWVSMSVIVD
jgi:hypothetical protein